MSTSGSWDRFKQRVMCTAAIATIAGALVPSPAKASERIPFTMVDGLIEVQASLAGGAPVPMLVDLGAGFDVISETAARSLKFATSGRYTGWQMRGQRFDTPIGALPSIAIAGFIEDHPNVGVTTLMNGSGFSGLISATAFRDVAVTFDFTSNDLIIEDETSLELIQRERVRVPLALQDDRGISLGIFAPFEFGNGTSGLCEVDTGSQGYFLDARFEKELGVTPIVRPDDPKKRAVAVIPYIELAGAPATQRTTPRAIFDDLIFDCNVGNAFWAGRRFTLDIPDRSLYI